MQDHYRIVIVSDVHYGAHRRRWLNKMGITAEKYNRPATEARQWGKDNDADLFIVAGDLYDERKPLPADYLAAKALHPDLVVAGNHDIGAVGDTDALWSQWHVARGKPEIVLASDIEIVTLPWIRPSDYNADKITGWTIREEIARTRQAILEDLNDIAVNDIDQTRPAIGVGHVMLSYGGNRAQPREDDIVILGKDIVIPYEDLLALPNIGGWYLGHVHKPGRGYVGSTQPTDWGDLGEKSFTVVDITWTGNIYGAWVYETRQIPYTTSLKLLKMSLDNGDDYPKLPDGTFDAVQITVSVPEDETFDDEKLMLHLSQLTDHVEVIIDREVKRAARVETAEPLSKMPVRDAALMWHENRETEPELRDATMAAFDAITGED
jgi:DNA repair exonuclease SbcCD nuclease subunit